MKEFRPKDDPNQQNPHLQSDKSLTNDQLLKPHGIHPRQMGRTMSRSMGRSMNRFEGRSASPSPQPSTSKSIDKPKEQEPLSTSAKEDAETAYPGIRWKPSYQEAIEARELANQNKLSSIKEMPAERVISEIQESVGKGGVNHKADVEIIQYYLQEIGLLTETDAIPQDAEAVLEEAQLPNLIAALYTFQEEVLHWPKTDGNIGGPASKTLTALKTTTPDHAKAQMEKYPAIKAKREAQAVAEAKAAAELKEKQQKAAAQIKATRAAEKKEKERVEQLKGESSDAANVAEKLKDLTTNKEIVAFLQDYVFHNPEFVIEAIKNKSGFIFNENTDDLSLDLLNKIGKSKLAGIDQKLLKYFYDTLDWGWTDDKELEWMKAIDGVLSAEIPQKEELSPLAQNLQKQIKDGEDKELEERILELSSYVREQLEVYPAMVKAFKEQSNYTADEKAMVLGEIAFEAAKMEFLIGAAFYNGAEWETSNNSGEFVDIYTTKANYTSKKGEEVKSTAPWCAKFVGFIYNTVLGTHAINSNDPVRGFWGGSQISGGYENFFDYEEEEGGRFVGQKNVDETSPWKDLRIELKEKSTKAEKKEEVLDFFETHFTPQKGDIMITSRTKNNSFQTSKHVNFDTSHTTMVEKLDTSGEDVFLYTIEGNAGDKVTGKKYDLLETSGNESLASIVNISRMSLNNHGESTELRNIEEITAEKDDLGNQATFTDVEMVKPLLEMNKMLIDLSFELNGISKKEGTIYDIKFLKEENNKVE